jgi:phosphatidylglycerophosphate synthase
LSLLKQFKESLKTVEAEEVFDLLIFRPIAFLFVKITYPLDFLTPNLVSVMAMSIGILGGIMFGFGDYRHLLIGGWLYFSCNVLDCADGQIARLKKNGTMVGRVVDGFVDYTVSIAVFIGVGMGLWSAVKSGEVLLYGNVFGFNQQAYVWIIAIVAGLSSAIQAFLFDLYRNKFLEIVYGKFSSLEEEMKDYQKELERIELEPEKAGFMDSILINIYLKYTRLQLRFHKEEPAGKVTAKPNPKVYFLQNKLLLRLWSFIGSTTHITLCIACAFWGSMETFLLVCILPLNLLTLALYLAQSKVNMKFNQV